MKQTAALFFLLLTLSTFGQGIAPTTPPTLSHSGQFIVSGQPASFLVSPKIAADTSLVHLEPVLAAVSCERVKQALLTELTAPDAWRGKIFLVLHRARDANEPLAVTAEKFLDGWNYRIDSPDAVKPDQFVRVVTQVLLLEMANRSPGGQLAEAPAWLSEGMAELLLTSSTVQLVVEPPQFSANKFNLQTHDRTNFNALARAQQVLASSAPLTFDELSWPKPEQLSGDAAQIFRSSAEVFIHQLLRLKNGRAQLHEFIASLPRQLNWQLSFLTAFQSNFERQLDLEKWWALESAHFSGRDRAQSWTAEESWKKLSNILHPDVQVHLGANNSPMRAEVSLQVIIREWNYLQQIKILQEKIRQLKDIQVRVASPLITVTSQYRQTLENYLQGMKKTGPILIGKNKLRQSVQKIIDETVKQLDALDAKAEALRTMPIASGN